jgi:hypothetical protein
MEPSLLSYCYYLSCIRSQQQMTPTVILHYDPESRDLAVWFWYVA